MSKALKDFKKLMVDQNQVKKLWQNQTPGNRIAPPKAGQNDQTWQLRLDAGEVKNGKKRVYLQVNSQATNQKLKDWKKKNGTDANLAYADLDVDVPDSEKQEAFDEFWSKVENKAKDNLG